jgi:hypothetical protein
MTITPHYLTAIILVVASSAVAQGPTSNFHGSCADDPGGSKFAARACYTAFDPSRAGYGAAYQRPSCDRSMGVTDRQRDVLAKAYRLAPEHMRLRLCQLTQLFVAQSSVGSWSLLEGKDRPPGTGVYIGISEWKLASDKSVADAENETVAELLGFADSDHAHAAQMPRLHMTAPTDPVLTVLATLAHEMGHLLLSDSNADGSDPTHPRRKVSSPPLSACFENSFLGQSWDAEAFHRQMRRFVDFGTQNRNRRINPALGFDIEQLRSEVHNAAFDPVIDAVNAVYRSGEFVSLFAAVSPEEDFVETYKYIVLAEAMGGHAMAFDLDGRKVDVFDYLASPVPAAKVECLRRLGLFSSRP